MCTMPAMAQQNGEKLNVLLITIDDMNIWPGAFDGVAKTPNIDALAASGVMFSNAHCVVPASNPSRTALFTGMRPETTGQYTNAGLFRDKRDNDEIITLPEYLQTFGYETASAGKTYHHPRGKGAEANPYSDPRSWDVQPPSLVGIAGGAKLYQNEEGLGAWHEGYFDDYLGTLGIWGPVPTSPEESYEWENAKFCIDYLAESHDDPFFLACGIFAPHAPHVAPQKYFDMYPLDDIVMPEVPEDDFDDIPAVARENFSTPFLNYMKDKGEWRNAVQGYLACMSFADDMVGRVLEQLENSEYRDNTIVILLTDNGFQLGHKDRWEKYSLWRMATNTPMIIRPAGQTKGKVCERAVSYLDLYPTIVEMLDIEAPDHVQGSSITKWLDKPNAKRDIPAVITHGPGNVSVVLDEWNYIRYKNGQEELYNRSNDKFEYNNLAGEKKYDKLKDKLAAFIPVDSEL